jgi:hypothetical protein
MRMIRVPRGLRWAAFFLLLTIPLSAVQALLVSGAPWWDLPLHRMGASAITAAILYVPLAVSLWRGKQWAYWLMCMSASIWILLSLVNLVFTKSFWLAIDSSVLVLYWLGTWLWIRTELKRSYFDPKVSWYEGLPEAIPGIECELGPEENGSALRVCRLDRQGVFAFGNVPLAANWVRSARIPVRLQFRNAQLSVEAEPIRIFGKNQGFGLRFRNLDADSKKLLGDFVERLRGEGYV